MKKLLSVILIGALLCGAALAETTSADGYEITLSENATTGYIWSYTISDETVLAVTDDVQTAGDTQLVGAPGTHSWRVTGVAAGKATITFTNAQPWEGGNTGPAFTYCFTVDDSLAVTLTDTQGFAEEELPDWIVLGEYEDQATGLAWQYTASPDGIVNLEWETYMDFAEEFKEEGSPCNIGGLRQWAFRAIGEGDVTLTFSYPGAEEGAEPAAIVTYELTVGSDGMILPVSVTGNSNFMPETMRETDAE